MQKIFFIAMLAICSNTVNLDSFETANPCASVINKTSRGIVYNMPSDNMAVLAPDIRQVENMPGNKLQLDNSKDNMPNPLHPGAGLKKK
ncbi:MAG: hypothetical protein ABJB86_14570 [Bacteroidota bacterium]